MSSFILKIAVPVLLMSTGPSRAAIQSRGDFFDSNKMFYVLISDWDPHWNPDHMDYGARSHARSHKQAYIEIFEANAGDDSACPDPKSRSVSKIYGTKDFTLGFKGNTSRMDRKPNFKIKLTDKKNPFLGMKRINLNAMNRDVSQMREALAFELFKHVGVIAPGHTYAKFCVQNQGKGRRFFGLYSVIEKIDKSFLKYHFKGKSKGNLYEGNYVGGADLGAASLAFRADQSYFKPNRVRTYDLQTNEDRAALNHYGDFKQLVATLNGRFLDGTPLTDDKYKKQLDDVFDAKAFLRWAAVNVLLGAWDNYWKTPGNYYVYNGGRNKDFMASPFFHWVPWDYDNCFGSAWNDKQWQYTPLDNWEGSANSHGNLPLISFMLANPKYREYYLDQVESLLKSRFNEGWIKKRLQELQRHIEKTAYLEGFFKDPSHTGRPFTNDEISRHGFEQHFYRGGNGQRSYGILHYVRMRHDHAWRELKRLR